MKYIKYKYGMRYKTNRTLGYNLASGEIDLTKEQEDMILLVNKIIDTSVTGCKNRSTNVSMGDIYKGKDNKVYSELTVWGNFSGEDVTKALALMPILLDHIKMVLVPVHQNYTHIIWEWLEPKELKVLETLIKLIKGGTKCLDQ